LSIESGKIKRLQAASYELQVKVKNRKCGLAYSNSG